MMQPNAKIFRRARTLVAAFAALSLQAVCTPATAAWLPFNPPANSRWIIESKASIDDEKPLTHRTVLIKSRAEMTINGKTDDGFSVTLILRDATVEGNDPSLPLLRAAMQALSDIPINAITDKRGRPVYLGNLDQADAAIVSAVDKAAVPSDEKLQVVTVLHRMLGRLTESDSGIIAINYLDALPELAKAQATGAQAGEVKRTVADTVSHHVDAMMETKPSAGLVFLAAIGNVVTPAQTASILMQLAEMEFKFCKKSSVSYKDDMTLKMSDETEIRTHAFGYNRRKTESRAITLTQAPNDDHAAVIPSAIDSPPARREIHAIASFSRQSGNSP
jgi:hypothetical protein